MNTHEEVASAFRQLYRSVDKLLAEYNPQSLGREIANCYGKDPMYLAVSTAGHLFWDESPSVTGLTIVHGMDMEPDKLHNPRIKNGVVVADEYGQSIYPAEPLFLTEVKLPQPVLEVALEAIKEQLAGRPT